MGQCTHKGYGEGHRGPGKEWGGDPGPVSHAEGTGHYLSSNGELWNGAFFPP